MGTRSHTVIRDGQENVYAAMYRQYDGYPSGHGVELAEFLDGYHITNGLAFESIEFKAANGPGCLAAQLVSHFKQKQGDDKRNATGGIYMVPLKDAYYAHDYTYIIEVHDSSLVIIVKEYEDIIATVKSAAELKTFCLEYTGE